MGAVEIAALTIGAVIDALASDKKPPAGAPSRQAIYLSEQVTRHSVLPKSAGRPELSSGTSI